MMKDLGLLAHFVLDWGDGTLERIGVPESALNVASNAATPASPSAPPFNPLQVGYLVCLRPLQTLDH